MPALRNAKHEKFAQEIAKGANRPDAYLAAGYTAPDRKAAARSGYRLHNRADVRERIEELTAKPHARIATQQVAEAIRNGRPTLYREELCDLARRLALLGASDVEMAGALNIAPQNLAEWKARYPKFRAAIESGKLRADAEVAEKLYHRAKGYSHKAVKIFMPAGANEPVYAPYTEHYPPDTQAASLWLRNRQPHLWRDKREIEHQGTLEHRIAQMTPEERRARLFELSERARVIEHEPHELDPE